jgi:hypothetical protein
MTLVKTITSKMSYSELVGSFSDQFPTRGTPHNESPPRMTSCSFTREVSASDQGANRTTWCDPGTRTPLPRCVGAVPHAMQMHQLAARAGNWPRQES